MDGYKDREEGREGVGWRGEIRGDITMLSCQDLLFIVTKGTNPT